MTERRRFHLFQLLPLALGLTGILGWIATQLLPDRWNDTGLLVAVATWVLFGNAAAWSVDNSTWRRVATAVGGIAFFAVGAWLLWPLNESF